jgi:hypothetical protein
MYNYTPDGNDYSIVVYLLAMLSSQLARTMHYVAGSVILLHVSGVYEGHGRGPYPWQVEFSLRRIHRRSEA